MIELLTEFWEDYYYENPLEAHRLADGTIQFKDTGDSMIDRWEEQLAQGKTPDYMEAFNQEQLERLQNLRTRGKTKHGHLVKPPATLKGVTESVVQDAMTQGLEDPTKPRPYYPLRFKDDSE